MPSPSPAQSPSLPPPPRSLRLVYPPSPPTPQEISVSPMASPAFAPLSSPAPPSLQNFNVSATVKPWPPVVAPTVKDLRPLQSVIAHMPPPPPPSDTYQNPPAGRYPSLQTPQPPPPRPWAVSHPPPMPPPMLINGTIKPSPIGLPPSHDHSSSNSKSSSSSSSAAPVGLIVGISIGVAGGFFMIALVLLCFFQRRKQFSYFYDCESPPAKDVSYAVLPQHVNQKIPAPGLHHVQAPGKHFLLQPQVSSSGLLGSANSDSDSVFSPHALGNHAFGFPGNFTYEELVAATGGFSEANLLGEGGFGYVHEGVLPDGRKIAVKQLKMGSQQGEREFKAEVETISRVHHRHLVSLLGYCITGFNRLLVYEFVPNRTLEFHLHGKNEPVMNWPTRLKIAIGSAKGLAYLHEDCNPTIIHRDIKAANILLDSNFEVKVSDFGLAKFFLDANRCVTHVSTRVVGTFGYLAPEYAQSGKTSDKSDVFSYGVMLLELITGRPPIMEPESSTGDSLVSWARPFLRRALEDGDFVALVDPHLKGNYNREELAKMVACAAACVRYSSWRRPRMSQIIHALGGDVSMEDLDEGIRPGQSTVYGFDYDSDTLKEMNKLRMTLESRDNGPDSSGGSNSEGDHHP